MRKDPLITGMYYHIYNRGVDKRDIFSNLNDLKRFVLSAKKFNNIKPIGSLKDKLIEEKNLSGVEHPTDEIKELVSIVCFSFNPNHFHFIVKQEVDGGVSEFFKRLLGGYTNYFNITNRRNGSLFQGKFKSNLIDDDAYFLKIYPYAHMNYLVHDIPKEKQHLVFTSEKEYNSGIFNLVSKKEAEELIAGYGSLENFKKECLEVIDMIREERGLEPLDGEDNLPFQVSDTR